MKITKNFIFLFIILLVIALAIYKTNTIFANHQPINANVYQAIDTLEIADSVEKATLGLMWRKDLCSNCGMLFIFNPERIVHMWMKNTPTALDIIFIDHTGVIVAIHKHTTPFQESPTYTANRKVKYVLEMKAGFAQRQQLKVGMQFDMRRLLEIRTSKHKAQLH